MMVAGNTFRAGQMLTADICIIGSGPAAISMALRLNESALSVIMLTGGGWTETAAVADTAR